MEREINSENRKRTRDDQEEDKIETHDHKDKKQETMNNIMSSFDDSSSLLYDEKGSYEFCDGIGVFDFPWLKEEEGHVVFKTDEYFDITEDAFTSCSSCAFAPNLDESCAEDTLITSSVVDQVKDEKKFDDDNSLWRLQVDDLEPIDRIWSSVLDEPLDNIGFNKA